MVVHQALGQDLPLNTTWHGFTKPHVAERWGKYDQRRMSSYEQLASDAVAQIDGAGDLDSLEALRPTLLGKKAAISLAKKDLGSLEPENRKEAGQAINAARQNLSLIHI